MKSHVGSHLQRWRYSILLAVKNPNGRFYAYQFNALKMKSRFDYLLIAKLLGHLVPVADIKISIAPYHRAVRLGVKMSKISAKKNDRWATHWVNSRHSKLHKFHKDGVAEIAPRQSLIALPSICYFYDSKVYRKPRTRKRTSLLVVEINHGT